MRGFASSAFAATIRSRDSLRLVCWFTAVVVATFTAQADAMPLAQRIDEAAAKAPHEAKPDGTLYGMQRWRASTGGSYAGVPFPGLLSCAYTVSAILAAAGYPIGEIASVKGVDRALESWPKIADARRLQPGDVVFWKPSRRRVLGIECPSGHWHVGVFVGGDDTIDNNWWSGMPRTGKLQRLCVDFAWARRAPSGNAQRVERPAAHRNAIETTNE